MDVYIIIGNPSVGKSSLVRALTGIRNADERLMARQVGNTFSLWAKDSSLQEASIDPAAFIADVAARNVDAALLTLWPRSRRSQGIVYPDDAGYIRDFQNAGWQVQPVVILDRGQPPAPVVNLPNGVTSTNFSNLQAIPFNSFAATVRTHWNWV